MKTTYIPCVKGTIGDWTYYTTVMSVTDIVQYVEFAEQVCPNEDLDLMIQREVSERSTDIANYLRTNEQRFLGSLIIAVYDGKPRFLPVSFEGSDLLEPIKNRMGILQFDGQEKYYAVDGQHRLAAMRMEIKRDPARYENDQVSVIVICHDKNAEGMARARRLFTTVNRYAKKTATNTNIVMDEDDGIAIITRRLIREHPLFQKRIKVLSGRRNGKGTLATGDAMQVGTSTDAQFLMAIGTFYKCNQALLPSDFFDEFSKKQQVPQYESLEHAYERITQRWDRLVGTVEPWKLLLTESFDLKDIRTNLGGHILVRPVGITSFVRGIASHLDVLRDNQLRDTVTAFNDITVAPWNGILWNSATKKMIATRDAEQLAQKLWRHLFSLPEDTAALEKSWRAHVDPSNEQADHHLPSPVTPYIGA